MSERVMSLFFVTILFGKIFIYVDFNITVIKKTNLITFLRTPNMKTCVFNV